jgi:outer membrane biosynthesis protein TonB
LRADWTISAIGHVAAVVVVVVSFATSTRPARDATDWMPVNIVSESDVNRVTPGEKSAPQSQNPMPVAEKVAEPKRVEDSSVQVAEKEVKGAREAPPEAEVKPVEKQQPETKPDPIAETLEKEKRPEPKRAAAKTPTPPKKPPTPAPKYDPKAIEALLDKRDATRVASAGEVVNNKPALGLANGQATEISQNELEAFKRRLSECWTPPAGVTRNTNMQVVIRVLFNADGSVAKPPVIVSGPASALGPAMAESATRAILRCQPFQMLKPEHYAQWKDIEITFDPREMFQG